jgi:hypothetical protein
LNAGGDQAALYFSLDAGPHPRCIALQTNGGFLVGGNFTTAMGATRNAVVRGYDKTTRDDQFNPNVTHSAAGTDASVQSLSPQSDGKVVLAGSFTTVGGEARSHLARVTGGHGHATLEASADGKRVTWTRGGANAEVDFVDFDYSLDGGVTWHDLGSGTRIGTTSDWERTGLNLPKNRLIQLRAHGHDFSAGDLYGGASAYAAEAQVYLDGSQMRINEVDALTQSGDTREFIELFDGGSGNTPLDGLAVVLFDGATDTSYQAIDLDGQTTDADGYFVIGNAGTPNVDLVIPDGTLQNGADAVALFEAGGTDFPNGTGVTVTDLIDAVVYGTGGEAEDAELLALLLPGQSHVDENGNGSGSAESVNRIPNGGGFQRESAAFYANTPTPGTANLVPAPMNLDLTDASDSGESMTDDLTNVTTPTIEGTAIPGSVVVLTSSLDGVLGNATTDGSGDWAFTPASPLSEGDHTITGTAGGSVASDPLVVSIDSTGPGVTVEVDAAQDQPAAAAPVNFDIAFSEAVTGFDIADVILTGSAIPSNPQLTMGAGNAYDFAVLDFAGEGEVVVSVPENMVTDAAGNGNTASTSLDNVVEIDLHDDRFYGGSPTPIILNSGSGTATGWLGRNRGGGGDFDAFTVTVSENRFYTIRTTGGAATIGSVLIEIDERSGVPLNSYREDDDRGEGDNFETTLGLSPGDYTILVRKDDNLAPGAAYTLEISEGGPASARMDSWIIGRPYRKIGDGRYRTSSGQTERLVSKNLRPVRTTIAIENEGDFHDHYAVRCPQARGVRAFRVVAREQGRNITAALARGSHQTRIVLKDRWVQISLTVYPNRNRLTKKFRSGNRTVERTVRTRFSLPFHARSTISPQWDIGRIDVFTK